MSNEISADGPSVDKIIKILASVVAVAVGSVVFVFGAYFFMFGGDGFSRSSADWGTFGDFVGGSLNPLLSFFGLIALLLTIVLQGRELELTRKELKRSADSQEKTQLLLDSQIKTQAKQQFESTYFSLLNQHNKKLEDILAVSEAQKSPLIYSLERSFYKKWIGNRDLAVVSIEDFSRCVEYFQIIHQVMRFNFLHSDSVMQGSASLMNHMPVTQDELSYAEILKAHLSGAILTWIAIYGVLDDKHTSLDGQVGFSWLLKRYNLLENMRPLKSGDLQMFDLLKKYYEISQA